MLGPDKTLSLFVNGITRGDGTYRYGKDGYVTLIFLYGEMKGVSLTREKDDRYLYLDDGKTLSRFWIYASRFYLQERIVRDQRFCSRGQMGRIEKNRKRRVCR